MVRESKNIRFTNEKDCNLHALPLLQIVIVLKNKFNEMSFKIHGVPKAVMDVWHLEMVMESSSIGVGKSKIDELKKMKAQAKKYYPEWFPDNPKQEIFPKNQIN